MEKNPAGVSNILQPGREMEGTKWKEELRGNGDTGDPSTGVAATKRSGGQILAAIFPGNTYDTDNR